MAQKAKTGEQSDLLGGKFFVASNTFSERTLKRGKCGKQQKPNNKPTIHLSQNATCFVNEINCVISATSVQSVGGYSFNGVKKPPKRRGKSGKTCCLFVVYLCLNGLSLSHHL